MKLKYSNCNDIQKLNNSNCDETQIMMNLKNYNFYETQKLKLWWNSTQIVRKLKNTYYNETKKINKIVKSKTQKLKLWQNSKTQTVTKHKFRQISNYEREKLNNSQCFLVKELSKINSAFEPI